MRLRFPVYAAAAAIAGFLTHTSVSDRAKHPVEQPAAVATTELSTTAAEQLCKLLGEPGNSCLPGKKKTVRFLIATVPDPKQTSLGLYFDRSIEAVIWAVGDVGYSFENYWLPWKPGEEENSAASSETQQPGFLLFRGSMPRDFLVVWLVGESPTGGIETAALNTAIDSVWQYDSKAPLRIVGPSFSGSFLSLGDAIEQRYKQGQSIQIVTGMASSLDAENKFTQRLNGKVDFEATVENSSVGVCRFFDYLHAERASKSEVAILAEDETVFGEQTESIPCLQTKSWNEGLLLVRFPREIARLRNSSERAAAASASADSKEANSPPSEGLTFTLRSPPSGSEELPLFSGQQGPLSQQSALLDLANALQHEHVRYAAIIATDVLDQIFLARFLHRACPDVRLIVFDADLLFVSAESSGALDGILNVSTYPLFLRNQHWTAAELSGELPRRIPFASQSTEGTYNAARELLSKAGLHGAGEALLEYRDPYRPASVHPPLWLSVLGRTGYWPVALLPESAAEEKPAKIKSSLLNLPKETSHNEVLHPERPSHAWQLVVILVSIVSCFQCLYVLLIFRLQLSKREMWKDRFLRSIAGVVYRLSWLFPRVARPEFSSSLLSMTLALAAAEAVFAASGVPYAISTAAGTGSSLFWFLIFPCFFLAWLFLCGVLISVEADRFVSLAYIWAIWICFLLLWFGALHWFHLDDMAIFFFAYRTVHPASGVSPGIPVLLLIAVWFLWGVTQLTRRAGLQPPEVPALDEPRMYAAKLNEWLPRPFPLGILPLLLLFIFWTFVRPRSVENHWYDDLITLLVLAAYFLMFSAWGQLLFAWQRFRRFLESLERHAVRDAFSKLPKELATLPLLNRGRQKPFLMATGRCCDTLTAIANDSAIAKDLALQSEYEERRLAIRTRVSGLLHLLSSGKRGDLQKARMIASIKDQLERSVLHTANALIDYARTHFWRQGKSESAEAEETSDKRQKLSALDIEEKTRILAEEFIALRFTMYIVYVIDQMKKMMWFVVISFVLLIAALNLYPFESPRLIDLSSIAVFVLLAIGTVTVLAQMDRDAILSRLTDTTPNKISGNFFLHVARFGILPLVTLLSTQFPSIRTFLFSWIQPALQALGNSG